MIAEVKGLATIRGYRNLPRGDVAALARAVAALSRLALVAGQPVAEAEINPLIVKRDGVVAVDGLVVLERLAMPLAGAARDSRGRGFPSRGHAGHPRRGSGAAHALPHRRPPAPQRSARSGLAAAALWQLRGGRTQRVAVDLRAAAASLRSSRYLRIDGQACRPSWDVLERVLPGARWLDQHPLQLRQSPRRRARRARRWRRIAPRPSRRAARGTASRSRTRSKPVAAVRASCDPSRSGRSIRTREAVAGQPLLEIERIGDSPPEPLPAAERPLAGVRVLDLTRVLAGPTCARSLAEHGADVLKITAAHLPDSGLVELDTGIGKLSARLDLRTSAGVDVLRALARDADVFSQSYRPGALAARGFSPQALAALRPGIVCVSLSAWGGNGPWRERRGFDSIVQSVSGMALASGEGGKPQLLPVSAIDYVSGYLMAFGAMVALARRARGRRQLAGARRARPRRQVDRRPRRAARRGVARHARRSAAGGARAAARGDGCAGRPDPLPAPGRAAFGNAAVLEPAAGAARLPSAGVAAARLTGDERSRGCASECKHGSR